MSIMVFILGVFFGAGLMKAVQGELADRIIEELDRYEEESDGGSDWF